MFYDLNDHVNATEEVDTFTIAGVPYELGEIPEKVRKQILAIDPKSDMVTSWRPVVAFLLEERNQVSPYLPDNVVAAIIPVIVKKLHADRQ